MKLNVIKGPDIGVDITIDEPGIYLIGRSSDCKLCLTDPEASRRHAAIRWAPDHITIEDQTSRNGTRVNETRVQQAVLKNGDVIRVGGTSMVVSEVTDATPSPEVTLHGLDPSLRVLASLNHREADLLAGVRGKKSDPARENEILRGVGEVTHLLVSGASHTSQLQQVLNHIKTLLDADSAVVMLRDAKSQGWITHAVSDASSDASSTVNVSRTIINQAVQEGMALLTENPLADDRFGPIESIMTHKISSALCAPMTIDDKLNGALCIDRRNRRDAFTPLDLRFTATVANVLGVYLEKLRLEDEYIKQERLAAVGQVIAGLAHYAKNIITGLQLSVAGLQRLLDRKQFDDVPVCVASIATEEQRLTNLILDMLSYAKDRKPMRMEVDINSVLNGVVRPYQEELARRSVELVMNTAADLPPLMAERNALHRVCLNLFVNAMDALDNDEEGRKTIRITSALSEDGASVELAVWDSGCGIPAAERENIFGVFFSTKGSRGTGLGLAVSRKIVEEHHGTISVTSEEGQWTEFRIQLPIEKSVS